MKLYYSLNFNPRVTAATATHLGSPVEFVAKSPADPANADFFRGKNPNLLAPILEEDDGSTLWEADAIACRLSQLAGSEFWRTGAELPRMVQWVSWAAQHLNPATGAIYFERLVKPKYGLGDPIERKVEAGLKGWAAKAPILEAALEGREWLLDDLSYADFRVGTALPFADQIGLPLQDYPNIRRLSAQLDALQSWRNPAP